MTTQQRLALTSAANQLAIDGIVLEISTLPNLKVSVLRERRTDAQIEHLMRETKVRLSMSFQELMGEVPDFKIKYRVVEAEETAAFNARCMIEAMEILGKARK